MKETVVVLGASSKPDRYSHKAMLLLEQHGHTPVPVHPREKMILDHKVFASLSDLEMNVDTVTLYVRPEMLRKQIDDLVNLRPWRVIMNPGTEDDDLAAEFRKQNIDVVQACTLVMLNTDQFER
jgi:predicted CoA-binding protein